MGEAEGMKKNDSKGHGGQSEGSYYLSLLKERYIDPTPLGRAQVLLFLSISGKGSDLGKGHLQHPIFLLKKEKSHPNVWAKH